MPFNPNFLATEPIQRIRLMAGDVTDFPVLEDNTYAYLYEINNYNELATAIEAVETIITILVMNPLDTTVGETKQQQQSVSNFQRVLSALKSKNLQDKTKTPRIPVIIRSDKEDWSSFDKLFKD